MPSLLHQIRRGFGPTVSGILPNYATPIGTPLGSASVDPNSGVITFGLANGCKALATALGTVVLPLIGYQARDSRGLPGLTDTEQFFGFGLGTPYLIGTPGSVEPGAAIECEGNQYVLNSLATAWPDGTTTDLSTLISSQGLTTSTALQTELTIANGLFAAAASGDMVTHRLQAIMSNTVNAGNLRIYAYAIPGYVKA